MWSIRVIKYNLISIFVAISILTIWRLPWIAWVWILVILIHQLRANLILVINFIILIFTLVRIAFNYWLLLILFIILILNVAFNFLFCDLSYFRVYVDDHLKYFILLERFQPFELKALSNKYLKEMHMNLLRIWSSYCHIHKFFNPRIQKLRYLAAKITYFVASITICFIAVYCHFRSDLLCSSIILTIVFKFL